MEATKLKKVPTILDLKREKLVKDIADQFAEFKKNEAHDPLESITSSLIGAYNGKDAEKALLVEHLIVRTNIILNAEADLKVKDRPFDELDLDKDVLGTNIYYMLLEYQRRFGSFAFSQYIKSKPVLLKKLVKQFVGCSLINIIEDNLSLDNKACLEKSDFYYEGLVLKAMKEQISRKVEEPVLETPIIEPSETQPQHRIRRVKTSYGEALKFSFSK